MCRSGTPVPDAAMFAIIFAACMFAAALALSLLLGDALVRQRADEDARARRRARVFRMPSRVATRPLIERRRGPVRDVALERRRAA